MYDIPPDFFFTKVKNEKLPPALLPFGKQPARRGLKQKHLLLFDVLTNVFEM